MNYQQFIKKIKIEVTKKLLPGQKIEVRTVRKNNNTSLQGLFIYSNETNITPTIYLEPYYEQYLRGTSLEWIANKIWSMYQNSMPSDKIDMSFFNDFEKVKNRITYKLINYEKNKELLQDIPHIPFLNLAIVFYYAFYSPELGNGSILINNSFTTKWDVDSQKLMQFAEVNTKRLFPSIFLNMNDIIGNMFPCETDFDHEAFVLTNSKKEFGAATILYPQLLEQISQQLQCSFYLIPSSIHEMIIIADKDDQDVHSLHDMIVEVNCHCLAQEEILSDYPFYYDHKEKQLTQLVDF